MSSELGWFKAKRDEAVAARDVEAFRAAQEQLLAAERSLACAASAEYAEPLSDAGWTPSHPTPLVWSDGFSLWLICPTISTSRPLLCRVVKFTHLIAHKVASVSDGLDEQPLSGKGLESCAALEVRNSTWIGSLKATHDHGDYWSDVRHFALCFKDCLVEVIAKSAEWIAAEQGLAECIADATEPSTRSPTFCATPYSPPP